MRVNNGIKQRKTFKFVKNKKRDDINVLGKKHSKLTKKNKINDKLKGGKFDNNWFLRSLYKKTDKFKDKGFKLQPTDCIGKKFENNAPLCYEAFKNKKFAIQTREAQDEMFKLREIEARKKYDEEIAEKKKLDYEKKVAEEKRENSNIYKKIVDLKDVDLNEIKKGLKQFEKKKQ